MKKHLSLLFLFVLLSHSGFAAYSVYDARANALLRQIKNINQAHLTTTGNLLNVNQSELQVLQAIYTAIGEPTQSSRILTGKPATGPSGGLSALTDSISGMNLPQIPTPNLGNLGGIMADVEAFMAEMPGYEDFDIGSMFKGLGHINTFIDGDFAKFRETIGDPSKAISDRLKSEVMGFVEGSGLLSDFESQIGRRIVRMAEDGFSGRRNSILGSVSKMFMARVMENVNSSAQRNELLAKETQQAYDEAAQATTFTGQMAAQNRIQSGNNMIQLERNRVINDTAAASVTIQGKELDVLEFQERDRFLDNALK